MSQLTAISMASVAACACLVLCIVLTFPQPSAAAAARRSSPFLIGERPRRPNRQTECTFDRSVYEIGATWFPDFGPPSGINYCYRCECVAQTKQRRVTARSICTNIRDQCPPLPCAKPVRMAGRCCKVCPGMEDAPNSPDVQLMDTAPADEPEALLPRRYAALLTGRTSAFLRREAIKAIYTTKNPLNIVATGRFLYTQKSLYYSFYVSQKAARPRIVQFIDPAGRILQELSLIVPVAGPLSEYQNNTGKTCGVWRRMSADVRQMLRAHQISVVLMWGGPNQTELALAGRIKHYAALPTEMFSTLLEAAAGTNPEHMRGAGGTAIVWSRSGAAARVNVTLVFNGLFGAQDVANVSVNVRVETTNGSQVIANETLIVAKPALDYNVLEISAALSTFDLRQLTAGKLTVVVESQRNRNLRIRGPITTRVACEQFQNVLTPELGDRTTRSSGLAWMYVNANGGLAYSIRTDGVDMRTAPVLMIADEANRKRIRLGELHGIRANLSSGIIDRFGPRVVEALYGGRLSVNLARSSAAPAIIRGRMAVAQVADARDTAEPVLLRRMNHTRATDLVGMVWLAVDNECSLRYEVTLNARANRTFQLYLTDVPFEAPGAPVKRRLLDTWHGPRMEGFQRAVTSADLLRLETHVVHLLVQSKGKSLLRGRFREVKIPTHCEALADDKEGPLSAPQTPADAAADKPCFESRRFHKDGEQWRSEQKSCTICSCLHGDVQCEPMRCPPLLCPEAERQMRPGECCASCAITNATMNAANATGDRGCWLGQQFHLAGATFHPYLPPNSYDTCAICTCDPLTLEVMCPRVQCPRLACSDLVAYRPDKKACCKQCPVEEALTDAELMQDEAGAAASAEVDATLSALSSEGGGCQVGASIYANGQEWHPRFASGVKTCVVCRCVNSQASCDAPRRCTPTVCESLVHRRSVLRQRNNEVTDESLDECCEEDCKRFAQHRQKPETVVA